MRKIGVTRRAIREIHDEAVAKSLFKIFRTVVFASRYRQDAADLVLERDDRLQPLFDLRGFEFGPEFDEDDMAYHEPLS